MPSTAASPRRRALRRGAAGAAGLALAVLAAGCGFELRRAPVLAFSGLQLKGFAADSPLAAELRERIDATPATRVVDSAAQAQVVLEAEVDRREKGVVATTAAALVREVQLRVRLIYLLRRPDGRALTPPVELRLERDMSYTERDALAKEEEEAFLYRAMQADVVTQLMRRLAAVPPLD